MAEQTPVVERLATSLLGEPATSRTPTQRLRNHLRHPLQRNAYALVVSGVFTLTLGMVYWVVVARRYTEEQVGIGAAAVSAMMLVANASGLGLQNGLIRLVPSAGTRTRRFVGRSLLLAAAVAAVAATVFVAGLTVWAPALDPLLRGGPLHSLGFVAATAIWVLFVLQDNTLIGLRRATYIPFENLGFSVAKIVLVLVLAVVAPTWGVFASWPLAAAGAVAWVAGFLLPRLLTEATVSARSCDLPPPREVRRYLAGEHVSVLLWMSTIEAIPLVVLHRLGAAQNAHYALAVQVVYGLMLLPASFGVAFTAESATHPRLLQRHLRKSTQNIANLLIPAVALVVVFAPLGLRLFGAGYSRATAPALRLMALSTLPYSVTLLLMNVARVQRRIRTVMVTYLVLCSLLAGLAVVLMGRFGLTGIGAAWLISQSVVALGVLATQLHRIGIRAHVDWLVKVTGVPRTALEVRRGAWRLRGVIHQIPELGTIRSCRVLSAHHDVIVAVVRSKEQGLEVLKVAQSPGAVASLRAAADAMVAARELVELREVVPEPRPVGTLGTHSYSIEEYRPGDTGLERLRANELSMTSLVEVLDTLGALHRATSRSIVADRAWLRRWVHAPLDRLAGLTDSPATIERVAAVRHRLVEELSKRPLTVSRIHGDVSPGNVLLELKTGGLEALIDWEASSPDGLPEIDVFHLLASLHVARSGVELDSVVPMLAAPERWTIRDRSILEAAVVSRPNRHISPWTLATLAWLAHVDANLRKARRYLRSNGWFERNVEEVLASLVDIHPSIDRRPSVPLVVAEPARSTESSTDRSDSRAQPSEAAIPGRPARVLVPSVERATSSALAVRWWSHPGFTVPLALALWGVGLRSIDLRGMSDLGLLSVLGPMAYAGLAVLLLGVVVHLAAPTFVPRRVGTSLVALLVVLHGTPAWLYGSLRYSWAWKHVGIVDFIDRTGSVDRDVASLAVYHQWPGFFTAAGTLTKVVGADNALTIASWAPLFFNVLVLVMLLFLFGTLTSDRRVVWLAATLFFITNWVGQDYFSPQAFTYVLYLGTIAMVLQRFPRDNTNQPGRSWRVGPTAWVICVVIVAVATSHQLTPLMLTIALAALALTRRARTWRFAAFSALVSAAWMVTWAQPFVSEQLNGILDRFGSLADNTNRTLSDTSLQSSGQALVSSMGRLALLLIGVLAAAGFITGWRRGRREWTAAVLAACPASILVVNDYGGEVVFRVVLFSMPFLAYLAARAVVPEGGRWRSPRTLIALGLSALLLSGFLFGYYGKERQYYFTPDEIGAVDYLEANATDGSALVTINFNYPNITDRYERFTFLPITAESKESFDQMLADPVGVLVAWMGNPDYDAVYLLITRSQLNEVTDLGEVPVDRVFALTRAVRDSDRFQTVYISRDATVYRLADPLPSPKEPS